MGPFVRLLGALALSAFASIVAAEGSGKLQIHYMDVGQGDGAVLISPHGEVVMFDDGIQATCNRTIAYLEQLGVSRIDYHVNSHYHKDHFGCIGKVLSQFPLKTAAFDRGTKYPSDTVSTPKSPKAGSIYEKYADAVQSKRQEAPIGKDIVLDADSANPVRITFVASNGNGVRTINENDLSLVANVEFGQFRTEFGGDLSGENQRQYQDIETSVAPMIGQIDVYKVHHHCSSYSSNQAWLEATRATVAIVSTGDRNVYKYPAQDCIDRLHKSGIKKVYWTEKGNGATPDATYDVVAGNVIVEVAPGASNFTVTYQGNHVDTYGILAAPKLPASIGPEPAQSEFAWASGSPYYHYANCEVVKQIKPENLLRNSTPPPGKKLHKDCPWLE